MKRAAATILALIAVSSLLAQTPSGRIEVKLNGHTFTLPAGFEIELVAGPPLVDRPIAADFDELGRLYVTDSSGSNEKTTVQLEKKPHRIVRLEDSDGDGKFDKSVVFADRLMFPEGIMYQAGSVYVAAPPSIWKLTDADGDGVAEQRSEWFQGKTLTGCANDLHGPYAAPDGWIYWCKGAFAQQSYERPGKPAFNTRASHIFRCKPDGSGLEHVMTGGMDNPVDVVFTPGGERIFTTTFFQFPGNGQRDGLIHAVYGGVYGKDWDVIYDHPWTGPAVMPVLTHMGAAAPCGLHRYESYAFGPEYRDNIFACLFNMRKVTRHVLEPAGATFKSRDEDFLVSDHLDFHPTDVIEDADGSLLVVDTGGWYKLCCPTSQLVKPDVLGAIYRIRRSNARPLEDARGLKIDWLMLSPRDVAKLLGDVRPSVRRRAVDELVRRGASSVSWLREALLDDRSVEAKRNALWALTRIDQGYARSSVRDALKDRDETVRQVALHSVSLWRDAEARQELIKVLRDSTPHNRRAAAEALGRIGDPASVPALLSALPSARGDRFLEHSITFALIEIGDAAKTSIGLTSDPQARRAALTALDQMGGKRLAAETVAKDLDASDADLKATAWWIVGRHPEWGGKLSSILRDRLAALDPASEAGTALVGQLARLSKAAPTQELLAECLRDDGASAGARRVVLRAMAQASLREAPESWLSAVTLVLGKNDVELLREAVSTARALRVPAKRGDGLVAALRKLGANAALPTAVRVGALAALPSGLTAVDADLLAFLLEQVRPDQPVATRSLAADVLARARLTSLQLAALTEVIKVAGPMEANRLLEAFGQTKDDAVGQRLVTALMGSASRPGLPAETLRARLAGYSAAVHKAAEPLFASLQVDSAKQRAQLENVLASIKDGDIRRGQAVFNSPKAACATCHSIGYLGGKLGPDLTRIGGIRSERDLLEAILFPSASFVRGYEPITVSTTAGKLFNGLLRKDSAEELVLAVAADQEAHIPRTEIEEILPSRVSVMPAGLDQQLSRRDLADLVMFLKACK